MLGDGVVAIWIVFIPTKIGYAFQLRQALETSDEDECAATVSRVANST
jgi:hypothetical protein